MTFGIIMQNNELEDYIASNEWSYVNTTRKGSNDYNSHIGVLRIMFPILDYPNAVTTLLSEKSTEVWIQEEKVWNRVF